MPAYLQFAEIKADNSLVSFQAPNWKAQVAPIKYQPKAMKSVDYKQLNNISSCRVAGKDPD